MNVRQLIYDATHNTPGAVNDLYYLEYTARCILQAAMDILEAAAKKRGLACEVRAVPGPWALSKNHVPHMLLFGKQHEDKSLMMGLFDSMLLAALVIKEKKLEPNFHKYYEHASQMHMASFYKNIYRELREHPFIVLVVECLNALENGDVEQLEFSQSALLQHVRATGFFDNASLNGEPVTQRTPPELLN